jgi:hypothetical protein
MTGGGSSGVSRWHSTGWWAGVSGIATIIGLIIALIAYLYPRGPADQSSGSTLIPSGS